MVLHKIRKFYTNLFSICSNITPKFIKIAIFRSFVKQNNDSNKLVGMSMIFYCFQLNFSNKLQRFMSCVHKTEY
jgi:hypothetical protein